jgi:hypothetical protein
MTKTDFISQLTTAALECEKVAWIPHAFTLAQGGARTKIIKV